MELGYNKNLRLYHRTQYNPNTGRKQGQGKKKIYQGKKSIQNTD